MNLDKALERYEIDARARGYSLHTITHVKGCVGFLAAFLSDVPDVSRVTADDFRRFLSSLCGGPVRNHPAHEQKHKVGPTSINTYARAIKSFWSWLEAEGIITANPLASVKTPKKPKTMPKIYTEEELKVLLNSLSASPRERALVELFLDSGIRLRELAALKVGNVDLAGGRIKVLGKGGKERFAYFNPATGASLDTYLKENRPHPSEGDYLFLTQDGRQLNAKRIQAILQHIGRKAGINERLSSHKLRHTYATLTLKYGSNLEYLRITLGHSDIKTTSDSYLNVADTDVATAYQGFSPMAHLEPRASEELPPIKRETNTAKGILEVAATLEYRPPPVEPSLLRGIGGRYLTLDLDDNEILIESLQAYSTESGIEFRLFLFTAKPDDEMMNWPHEDLLQSDYTTGRVYTYHPEQPLYYRDYDKSCKLHVGLYIAQRRLRFDLTSDVEKQAYYSAPVRYTITLRYRVA